MSSVLLENITNRVNKMEDDGVVDIDIVKDLAKLKTKLLKIEDKWITNDDKNSFYFYQSVRNVELILEKMVNRFETAKENHDNPQVALDTLALIPIASDIIQLTESGKVESNKIEKILQRTHQLRDKAAETNLLESDQRDVQELDVKKLGKSFDMIMENMNIPVELPDDVQIDEEDQNSS